MGVTRDLRPNLPSERRRRPTAHPVRDAPGIGARRGGLRLLSGVLDRGSMADEAALEGLSPPARAEARALADLALRRLGQIDQALSRLVERKPKPPALHILRLMAAELLFAGTAPHAAVDSAVRLARSTKGAERLQGLVNAVGRRLADASPPQDDARARRANVPAWLFDRLSADWGETEADEILSAHLLPAPHDLVARAPEALAEMAATLHGRALPGGVFRLSGRPQISALPGFEEGAWWVQDWAASLPVRLLGDVRGRRVLDLCAAPGGKTMQLASAGADVTALDISASRMERLAENLARTGLEARLVTTDALLWQPEERFDAILLDAPCSATGTIRRHPDLPWRRSSGEIASLLDLQARLIDRAFGWLAPGGRLVYATCSLFRAEGEVQAERFLARTPDATHLPLAPGEADIPEACVTPDGNLRTRPSMMAGEGGLDGFFAFRAVRRA